MFRVASESADCPEVSTGARHGASSLMVLACRKNNEGRLASRAADLNEAP